MTVWRVSIHALAKSATPSELRLLRISSSFNPRAREERDRLGRLDASQGTTFQSTRSRRARLPAAYYYAFTTLFQSTRSRRARQTLTDKAKTDEEFQSTRSRRARPNQHWPASHERNVSIHALAKSATPVLNTSSRPFFVSIHALAKSATEPHWPALAAGVCFNPRAREERDEPKPESLIQLPSFNPRAREERDCLHSLPESAILCFNPRAREERDLRNTIKCRKPSLVSIHALAKSATFALLI